MACMGQELAIRLARRDEVPSLPLLQVAAGEAFRALDMGLVADGPRPEIGAFAEAQQAKRLLVAVKEGKVVGFVRLEVLDAALHVEQVTVAPSHGGRGIGRRLMLAAEDLARERGYDRMTLTAFRDVPFNGPFYESLGWLVLPADELPPDLAAARREEAEAGLDSWPRQAMVRHL
jgi:GNAT superfamily N-acetyltransferase